MKRKKKKKNPKALSTTKRTFTVVEMEKYIIQLIGFLRQTAFKKTTTFLGFNNQ